MTEFFRRLVKEKPLSIIAGVVILLLILVAIFADVLAPFPHEAIGSTRWRILIRHVLPNIAAPVIIIFTINVGGVIISEAALSFLGFGLPISVPSWGGMLSREGREFMEVAPRLALWPGLCLTIVVYCLNMFGDAVRDLLDPRLRGGVGRLGA